MKIFFCGDVMTGRGVDQVLPHPGSPRLYESYLRNARDYVALAEKAHGTIPRPVSLDYIWGDALDIRKEQSPDVMIANLETAITTSDDHESKGVNYRMHPANAPVLSAAQIDICSLANNHVLDWGQPGLHETLDALDTNEILHAGAGRTLADAQAPAVTEVHGGRVLVFGMCHASSGVPPAWAAAEERGGIFLLSTLDERAVAQVGELIAGHKRSGDVAVASIHWGGNWGYAVPGGHVSFAHALIDSAGVDIVHGHSSHHPRPIEIYQGRPIFYGCGDFINDYEGVSGYEEFRDDLTLMYFVDVDPVPFKFRKVEMHCRQIRRFRLQRAAQADVRWMRERLQEISRPFGARVELEENVLVVKQ
ncbi:MAG: CapA family protein [Anaerolineales bacterium]